MIFFYKADLTNLWSFFKYEIRSYYNISSTLTTLKNKFPTLFIDSISQNYGLFKA